MTVNNIETSPGLLTSNVCLESNSMFAYSHLSFCLQMQNAPRTGIANIAFIIDSNS
jgi:hypothetical protein